MIMTEHRALYDYFVKNNSTFKEEIEHNASGVFVILFEIHLWISKMNINLYEKKLKSYF